LGRGFVSNILPPINWRQLPSTAINCRQLGGGFVLNGHNWMRHEDTRGTKHSTKKDDHSHSPFRFVTPFVLFVPSWRMSFSVCAQHQRLHQ
jgi:hypothetical protein